jgi:hypothetical protein
LGTVGERDIFLSQKILELTKLSLLGVKFSGVVGDALTEQCVSLPK